MKNEIHGTGSGQRGFTVLRVAEAMLAVIVILFIVMVVSTAIKAGSAAKSAKYDASCIEALMEGKANEGC